MGNDSSTSVAYQNMVILHVQFLIKFKLTDSVDFLEKKKKKESKYCCCWPKSIFPGGPEITVSTMAPQNQHITEIRHLVLVREDSESAPFA